MDKVIAVINKNQVEEIRVALREFHGQDLLDIRVYFEPHDGVAKIATKKGVALQVGKLPELLAALREAERVAREAGLLAGRDAA